MKCANRHVRIARAVMTVAEGRVVHVRTGWFAMRRMVSVRYASQIVRIAHAVMTVVVERVGRVRTGWFAMR